ncbi:type II and III secretion system protein family protein [Sphingomonas sp. ASV193]|uniref:type II and III secretion system protein family protein n=1 Tax=Sphingomonas sp. ASV193 TaxID=3144405 RepID=UPI0032E91496
MTSKSRKIAALAFAGLVLAALPATASAQMTGVSIAEGLGAGELQVPVNKSQVLRSDRPYAKAVIANPEIADVLPLSNTALHVLGKKAGTTSLTLYDRAGRLIAVVDVAVGPDVVGLKRQLSELMPGTPIAARMANDSVVLEGIVSNAVAADRAVQIANTYAPGKVVNMLSLGSSQQVMLEVRFSEVNRQALKQIGAGFFVSNGSGSFQGAIGSGASLTGAGSAAGGKLGLGAIVDSFGVLTKTFGAFGLNFEGALDALEKKGAITTLAQPTLVALSGQTASFLAGGEFPVPVSQGAGTSGGNATITVEWKPFGVSLAFTPTVLADGVINIVVEPEVSSIDSSASVSIGNLVIPGLQTRRAKTVVELRDGESFALAGLLRNDFQNTIRQFPVLGSIPIIGTLFRSHNFQRQETELVITVTPRLVRPVPANAMKYPTDRVKPPNEADNIFLGQTDTGVRPSALAPEPSPAPVAPPPPPPAMPGSAMAVPPPGAAYPAPGGTEKDYGHVL